MSYVLMTGVTGLLGRYLLKDLLLAGKRVAVVARSARRAPARARVDAAVLYWEQQLGIKLPRPVILEGDITETDLGLDERAKQWIKDHCDTLLHNAASLTFISTGRDAEPWRSNLDGTRNVLELCRWAGIRRMFHVSTAYVCGLRTGLVRETELDVGQDFCNDYERSKVEAEKLVREADFLDSLTVFRPAIIVGDSKTGYTTTYHGFYAPVQALVAMRHAFESTPTGLIRASARFPLDGHESKNLVPVDWVSEVMAYVMTHPEHHGNTYNLTPRHPVNMRMMADVMEESIGFYAVDLVGAGVEIPNATDYEKLFQDMITVYKSYWRDDPRFDASNTTRAAPHLPCPHMNKRKLLMMAGWAIRNEFDTPKGRQPEPEFAALTALESLLELHSHACERDQIVGLQVRGHGGGQWHLYVHGGQVVAADDGLPDDAVATLDLEIETLADLVNRRVTPADALANGRIKLSGPGAAGLPAADILRSLTASRMKALQPQ